LVDELENANPKTYVICSILIIASILNEISQWMVQQLLYSGTILSPPPELAMIVQHCVFGGVLMLETHPQDDPQLAFVDPEGEAWTVSVKSLVSKGPEEMPLIPEGKFQKRRGGTLGKIGSAGGGLWGV
jgi:hypothetical protein